MWADSRADRSRFESPALPLLRSFFALAWTCELALSYEVELKERRANAGGFDSIGKEAASAHEGKGHVQVGMAGAV